VFAQQAGYHFGEQDRVTETILLILLIGCYQYHAVYGCAVLLCDPLQSFDQDGQFERVGHCRPFIEQLLAQQARLPGEIAASRHLHITVANVGNEEHAHHTRSMRTLIQPRGNMG